MNKKLKKSLKKFNKNYAPMLRRLAKGPTDEKTNLDPSQEVPTDPRGMERL